MGTCENFGTIRAGDGMCKGITIGIVHYLSQIFTVFHMSQALTKGESSQGLPKIPQMHCGTTPSVDPKPPQEDEDNKANKQHYSGYING